MNYYYFFFFYFYLSILLNVLFFTIIFRDYCKPLRHIPIATIKVSNYISKSRGVPSLFLFWKFFSWKYSLLALLRVDLFREPRFPAYLSLRNSFYWNHLVSITILMHFVVKRESGPSCTHLRVRTLLHGTVS